MNRLVLGIGTGRCGTQSLSALLDDQPGATVTHERFKAQVPWGAAGYEWMQRLINESPSGAALYGDVSLYWLPQIEQLLLDPDRRDAADTLRVVALQRDREATVESYMRKTGGSHGRNHWMVHDGNEFNNCDLGWDHCYPKFRASSKREALSMYWASYYGEVDRLADRFSEHVRCFDLDALNTREGQRAILQFVGVPDAEQVLHVGMRKNTTSTVSSTRLGTSLGSNLRTLCGKILPASYFS